MTATTSAQPVRVLATPSAKRAGGSKSSRLLVGLVLFQIACQIALLTPALGALRVPIRSAVFGASLYLFFTVVGRRREHPSANAARWVLGIVALGIFHPYANTLTARLAQAAMYLAIIGPIIWVPRMRVALPTLRNVILTLWAFHTLSSAVGVLQVYFPGEFQPNLSRVIAGRDEGYVNSLQITTATGERVFRPMGLTDIPGGASLAGMYAVLFGLAFFVIERRHWMRVICVASMLVGTTAMYMAQVRATVVVTLVCIIGFAAVVAARGRTKQFGAILVVVMCVGLAAWFWAAAVGGAGVSSRMGTLLEAQPTDIYYENRGHFLEQTFKELLPRFPLGAGLGRYGMMNEYFGNNANPETAGIWAEIQWTAWTLDGGFPLMVAYLLAWYLAARTAWRIARRSERLGLGDLWIWGALIVAYNIGALAFTFSYALFNSQAGLELWLLNGVMFAAARDAYVRSASTVPS